MDTVKLLETYTLAEILEYNDMTEDDLLQRLIDEGLELPPLPVDYDTSI